MAMLADLTKSPNLWLEDGNVILVAENTGFRLYRGLLAKHSEVFRDMFQIPQPEAAAENTFEGCPVIHLADDGAEEVAAVLTILLETNGSQRYVLFFRLAALCYHTTAF